MALIQTVNPSDLYHLACKMGRDKNFGYNGWRALGEYLEELSDSMGEDVEIDIIGLCCDYAMAESVEEFFMEFDHLHGVDLPEEEAWEELTEEEKLETIKAFLQYRTAVVVCEDDLIIWYAF